MSRQRSNTACFSSEEMESFTYALACLGIEFTSLDELVDILFGKEEERAEYFGHEWQYPIIGHLLSNNITSAMCNNHHTWKAEDWEHVNVETLIDQLITARIDSATMNTELEQVKHKYSRVLSRYKQLLAKWKQVQPQSSSVQYPLNAAFQFLANGWSLSQPSNAVLANANVNNGATGGQVVTLSPIKTTTAATTTNGMQEVTAFDIIITPSKAMHNTAANTFTLLTTTTTTTNHSSQPLASMTSAHQASSVSCNKPSLTSFPVNTYATTTDFFKRSAQFLHLTSSNNTTTASSNNNKHHHKHANNPDQAILQQQDKENINNISIPVQQQMFSTQQAMMENF